MLLKSSLCLHSYIMRAFNQVFILFISFQRSFSLNIDLELNTTFCSDAFWCENGTDSRSSCTSLFDADNCTMTPTLIFSTEGGIQKIDLQGHNAELLAQDQTFPVIFDFDIIERCLYWSYAIPQYVTFIKKGCSRSTEPELLNLGTNRRLEGLAVDWIGRNLYWTDIRKGTIEVSTLGGKYSRVLVDSNLEEPRAIALDPYQGYMYWSDWGHNSHIGKAGMDGTQARILINDSVSWPNALTIDFAMNEIYWGDAKENYIAVANLDGQNRRIVFKKDEGDDVFHIFSLAVFEDQLFWTDWKSKSIEQCNKNNCTNSATIATVSYRPMTIRVLHPFPRKPLKVPNPCDTAACSTLCLLKPGGGAACMCPSSFVLEKDKRSCRNNCSRTEFACMNYKCISKWWRCDTKDDCGDGSDEPINCPIFHCGNGQFQCDDGRCIEITEICDGVPQCEDHSDEFDCNDAVCLWNHFKCPPNGSTQAYCIPMDRYCNGNNDCPGGEDEMDCVKQECCEQVLCDSKAMCRESWQCSKELSCDSGRLFLSENSTTCSPPSFECSNHECIHENLRCNGVDNCGDLSDETNCSFNNCTESEFQCNKGRCIPLSKHCNKAIDCTDGSDEIGCIVYCLKDIFQCNSSSDFCIPKKWYCDERLNCLNASQENYYCELWRASFKDFNGRILHSYIQKLNISNLIEVL